jgi:hypothetical protein
VGVVVLGMHRSGTSVASRAINLLGVPFGGGRIIPTTAANPRGHWESWELQDVNNDLLAAFGGSWAGPPILHEGWEADERAIRLKGAAISAWTLVHSAEPWVWKDPRTCLTLPFWRRAVSLEGPAVVIYRQPDEVAASLARRDGFSVSVSLALWERYNRDALMAVRGLPVLVTSYDQLTSDPAGWVAEVRTFLGDQGILKDASMTAADAAAEIQVDLHRDSGQHWVELSNSQVRLLEALGEARGDHARFSPPAIGAPSPWLGPLLVEHGRAYDREIALKAELGRARSQLGHVINMTRVKVLAYRAYKHVANGKAPVGDRGDPTMSDRP